MSRAGFTPWRNPPAPPSSARPPGFAPPFICVLIILASAYAPAAEPLRLVATGSGQQLDRCTVEAGKIVAQTVAGNHRLPEKMSWHLEGDLRANSPGEIGIDDFQSGRSPDEHYRTTPLQGLFTRETGGFYHDGRFATYRDVVDHYDDHLDTGLTDAEKADLVEYLKSL